MVNTLGLYLGERERRGLRRAAGWNGASRIVNLVYFEVPVSTCSYKWPHAGGQCTGASESHSSKLRDHHVTCMERHCT